MEEDKRQTLKTSLETDIAVINKVQSILGSDKFSRLGEILENDELFHEFRNASLLDQSIADNEHLLPLTNISLAYSKFANLQKLLEKEGKAKEAVENHMGKESIQNILKLVEVFEGKEFVDDDINNTVHLYHQVRNIAVKCVVEKLIDMYSKPQIKPILNLKTDNVGYNDAVRNMEYLVKVTWNEKYAKAEDLNFDLQFLKIILEFWRENDKQINMTSTLNNYENSERHKDLYQSEGSKISLNNSDTFLQSNVSKMENECENENSSKEMYSQARDMEGNQNVTENNIYESNKVGHVLSINNNDFTRENLALEFSIDAMKKLKEKIEKTPETLKNVISIAGSDIFEKFLKMVSIFHNSEDELPENNDKIKNLYYSIKNASVSDPAILSNGNLFPFSNLALSVAKFKSLLVLIKKDEPLKNLIEGNFGKETFEKVEHIIAQSLEKDEEYIVNEYIEDDVTLIIACYHSMRQAALQFMLSKSFIIFKKMKAILSDNINDAGFVAARDRLLETVKMDWNEQVLDFEEKSFDFDFLNTLINYWKNIRNKEQIKSKCTDPSIFIHEPKERNSKDKSNFNTGVTQIVNKSQIEPLSNEKIQKKNKDSLASYNSSIQNEDEDPDDPDIIIDAGGNSREAVHSTQANKHGFTKIKENKPGFTKTVIKKANSISSNLPTNINCTLCSYSNLSNLEDLSRHYSLNHFRNQIEKKFVPNWTGSCDLCKQTLDSKPELIMHIGLEHGAVKLEMASTKGSFLCPFPACKKEFFNDTFYKQHLIGTHFHKEMSVEYLTSGYSLKCKFCSKEFLNKQAILFHIGIVHNQVEKYLLKHKKLTIESTCSENMKCKFCYIATNFSEMKVHYLEVHFYEDLVNKCKGDKLLIGDNICQLCKETTKNERDLVKHLGIDHNKILKFIDNISEKFARANFRTNNSVEEKENSNAVNISPKLIIRTNLPETVEEENYSLDYPRIIPIIAVEIDDEDSDSPDDSKLDKNKDFRAARKSINDTQPTKVIEPVFTRFKEIKPGFTSLICSLCSHKNANNLEDLLGHYSRSHFWDDIEKNYIPAWTGSCNLCNQTLSSKSKSELITHIGVEHEALELDIADTKMSFQCPIASCNKEFFTDTFYKTHLIELHFGKSMSTMFLSSSADELKCNFCEKKFGSKNAILLHIGIDHNKIELYLVKYQKGKSESKDSQTIKCKFCFLTTDFIQMKIHYLEDHFFEKLLHKIKEEKLMTIDNTCKLCKETVKTGTELVQHLGIKHNKILQFIDSIGEKTLKANFKTKEKEDQKDFNHITYGPLTNLGAKIEGPSPKFLKLNPMSKSVNRQISHDEALNHVSSSTFLGNQSDELNNGIPDTNMKIKNEEFDEYLDEYEDSILSHPLSSVPGPMLSSKSSSKLMLSPKSATQTINTLLSPKSSLQYVQLVLSPKSAPQPILSPKFDSKPVLSPKSSTQPIKLILSPKSTSQSTQPMLCPKPPSQPTQNMLSPKPPLQPTQVIPSPTPASHSISNPLKPNDEKVQEMCKICKFKATKKDELVIHRQSLGHKFKVIKHYSNTENAVGRICLICKKELPQQDIFIHLESEHNSKYITSYFEQSKSDIKEEQTEYYNYYNTPSNIVGEEQFKADQESINTEVIKRPVHSYWFELLKIFCQTKRELIEVQNFQMSNYRICSSVVLNDFFEEILIKGDGFSRFDEIIKEFGESGISFENGKDVKDLQIVQRYSLLKEYHDICNNVGTTIKKCDIMQIVIFLSQLLERTKLSKTDVEWTLLTISNFHENIDEKPLKENKKIIDFFQAFGFALVNGKTDLKEDLEHIRKSGDEKVAASTSLEPNNNKIKVNEPENRFVSSQVNVKRKIPEQINDPNNKKIKLKMEKKKTNAKRTITIRSVNIAVKDLAHTGKWGTTIRRRWKQMIQAGAMENRKYYSNPRKCKTKTCSEMLDGPLTTFRHIRLAHL